MQPKHYCPQQVSEDRNGIPLITVLNYSKSSLLSLSNYIDFTVLWHSFT